MEYKYNGIDYDTYKKAQKVTEDTHFIVSEETDDVTPYNNRSSKISVLNHAVDTSIRKSFTGILNSGMSS